MRDDTFSQPAPTLRDDAVAWLSAALAVVLYALWAAPALGWLDSGEMVAAARELGNLHPPGHPAWLSLAGFAELLPVAGYATRVAWLSALAAGASVVVLARLSRQLLTDLSPSAQTAATACATLTLLASGSLATVAVRAEVYTLALAGNLWLLSAGIAAGKAAANQPQPTRDVLVPLAEMTAAACLGLLNHHYVTIFALPAALLASAPAWWMLRKRPIWLAVFIAGGAFLGLGYLALALRSSADTEMRWGNPSTLLGFWQTVTAQQFQKSVTQVAVPMADNALVVMGMISETMGGWLAAAGGLGLLLPLARPKRHHLVVLLAFIGSVAAKAIMRVDTGNPDDHGYVLVAVAMLAVGVAQFVRLLVIAVPQATQRRWASGLAVALVAVGSSAQVIAMQGDSTCNLSQLRAPDRIDSQLRATLAPGAIYLSNYYGLAFNEQAFRLAEGRRPDVVAPHLSMRTGDTDGGLAYQNWFAHRYPDLRDAAAAASTLHRAPVGNFLARIERQPVYAEMDPEGRIPAPYFHFDGVVNRLLTTAERGIDYDLQQARRRQAAQWLALESLFSDADLRDHPTRAVLLWQHALQAAHALRRGWFQIAGDELEQARRLSPQDRLLTSLYTKQRQLAQAWQSGDADRFAALWHNWSTADLDSLLSP